MKMPREAVGERSVAVLAVSLRCRNFLTTRDPNTFQYQPHNTPTKPPTKNEGNRQGLSLPRTVNTPKGTAQLPELIRIKSKRVTLRVSPEPNWPTFSMHTSLSPSPLRMVSLQTVRQMILGTAFVPPILSQFDAVIEGFIGFQLPTSFAVSKPRTISVSRERPRHITMFPGGGSLFRAR